MKQRRKRLNETLFVRVSEEAKDRVHAEAAAKGVSVGMLVNAIIERHFGMGSDHTFWEAWREKERGQMVHELHTGETK